MSSIESRADWRTPTVVLVASGMVLTLAMGVRHGFGLFLQPMSADLHWGRETFALAIAMQNLVWGAVQPFTGMIADRFGTARVVVAGTVLYVLGLVAMAHATSPLALMLSCGLLIGTGLSGLTYSVIAGALGHALGSHVSIRADVLANARYIVFGLLILLFLVKEPEGLVRLWQRLAAHLTRRAGGEVRNLEA